MMCLTHSRVCLKGRRDYDVSGTAKAVLWLGLLLIALRLVATEQGRALWATITGQKPTITPLLTPFIQGGHALIPVLPDMGGPILLPGL